MKKENTYIMNLEAAYIYKDIQEGKTIALKERDLSKLFSATIPYSLETIRMDNMFDNVFYIKGNKQYTKKIVNVTFDKHYSKWNKDDNKREILANKGKIRGYLYDEGFYIDGKKYVFYKRGAGKAKTGCAFFIQENMKEPLLNRSRLGLKFEHNEKLDLTSLLAYESLISSGIVDIINLDPKEEILIIDDIYGDKFESIASVTKETGGKITTRNTRIEIQNCLTDGQGLMDESVFNKYHKQEKGFMLLRSDMFKCCAFNTKLQEWFTHNGVEYVTDMFGNTKKANKIKLVTTPNSLKFLKFAYKIGSGTGRECHEYWENNIDSIFGVVKYDCDGNFGSYNRLTYQLLNSIPSLSYEDLVDITSTEREYVYLLKNNEAVFRNHIFRDEDAVCTIEDKLKDGDLANYEAMESMYCLFLINPNIQYTSKFKSIRSKLIFNYVENLKMGKIRMKDTKYLTLVSNPYEMLLATIGMYNNKSIMSGREVYSKFYEDGQEFCISRNPHINSGNVMFGKNKYHEEYDMWFNFSNNVCAMNFFDCDAPDRLQGCDTDSDTALFIPNKILSEKAKYCEDNFPTPINRIKGRSVPKSYNMNTLRKLDFMLSNNYIGKIVNLSQIINSYMNDAISKGLDEETINELYQASSRLSSLSQIEIDKSKKVFDNVSMSKELRRIRKIPSIKYIKEKTKFSGDSYVDKMVVPEFFSKISESNDFRVMEKFDTPLDTLQDVLTFKGGKRTSNKEFKELLVKPKSLDGKFDQKQIKNLFDVINKCGRKINGLNIEACKLSDHAKSEVRRKALDDAKTELKKFKIKTPAVLNILRRCFKATPDNLGFSKHAMLSLNLLLSTNTKEVLECFNTGEINNGTVLVENDCKNSYNLFGKTYTETTIKQLKSRYFNKIN